MHVVINRDKINLCHILGEFSKSLESIAVKSR